MAVLSVIDNTVDTDHRDDCWLKATFDNEKRISYGRAHS